MPKKMTATQFKELIAKLGLSQARAGDFLGFSPRTSRRIAAGETPIPISAGKLLMLMVEQKITVDDVNRLRP